MQFQTNDDNNDNNDARRRVEKNICGMCSKYSIEYVCECF